ncbi:MAG TPA: hypothetical protein VN538_03240 [Clostridia bacterium]|nr:hypothetical protein [Clostridia bacterium]
MAYEFIRDGREVMLEIVSGADESISGLQVGNEKFVLMSSEEIEYIVVTLYGKEYLGFMRSNLLNSNVSLNPGDNVIVLESFDRGEDYIHADVFELLRLFKSDAIFSCDFLSYKFVENKMHSTGWGRIHEPYYCTTNYYKAYHLTDAEKTEFITWCKKYGDLRPQAFNKFFDNLLTDFQRTYKIALPNLSFIALFTILEMIFGTGNNEITYKISRGASLLLSTNVDSMKAVFKQMKQLYKYRSEYVHSGKHIEDEHLIELRDIVRRTLLSIIDLGYHAPDKDVKELSESLTWGGRFLIPPSKQ